MISESLAKKLVAVSEYLTGMLEPFPLLRTLEHLDENMDHSQFCDYTNLVCKERDYYKNKFMAIKEVFK